jgi:hypothetical protein
LKHILLQNVKKLFTRAKKRLSEIQLETRGEYQKEKITFSKVPNHKRKPQSSQQGPQEYHEPLLPPSLQPPAREKGMASGRP